MTAAFSVEADRPLSHYVAEEVRALRARRNLTQGELGEVLGITQGQVSIRLSGKLPFTLHELEVLAEFFSTTPAALLGSAASRVPHGRIGDAESGDREDPGAAAVDLRARRDSNPKPSDP